MLAITKKISNYIKLPTIRVAALYLLVLCILGVSLKWDSEYILERLLALAGLTVGYMVVPFIKHQTAALKYPFIANNLITIMIMFLVLDEFIPWWQCVLFGLVASLIKHFIRLNRQPVFNPAAAGIFVAVLLGALETWWGASFAPRFTNLGISIAAFLTLPVGAYLADAYKKWGVALSFIAVYGLGMLIWLKTFPFTILLEGTILFLAFIMVSEPKTSPSLLVQQIVFGSSVAILALAAIIFGASSPYTIALLVGNLGYRLYTYWQQRQQLSQLKSMPASTRV